ncbi:uncharacterized protein LOC62_01G001044 [Vanrija pseudolonga]|uniref:Uncharacterized protein n=1 Tax=Vanrija pseudolonga TaxID=143232 RepID=A0AAF0Y019_9TREE|nr:hypothetical protein LOC62_01G001044 [Vanrija pseudolonga]
MLTTRTAACVLLAGMLAHAAPVREGLARHDLVPRDDDTTTTVAWKDMTPGQKAGTVVVYVIFGLVGCGMLVIFCALAYHICCDFGGDFKDAFSRRMKGVGNVARDAWEVPKALWGVVTKVSAMAWGTVTTRSINAWTSTKNTCGSAVTRVKTSFAKKPTCDSEIPMALDLDDDVKKTAAASIEWDKASLMSYESTESAVAPSYHTDEAKVGAYAEEK